MANATSELCINDTAFIDLILNNETVQIYIEADKFTFYENPAYLVTVKKSNLEYMISEFNAED